MKNLPFLTLIFFTLTSQAQMGVTAGLSYSSFVHGCNTPMQRNEPASSITGGIYYRIGHSAGIIPSIVYVSKGAKTNYNGTQEYEFRTRYIELNMPLFIRLGHFDLQAGGYIAKLLPTVGNYYWAGKPLKWQGAEKYNTTSNWLYHTLDWGLTGGITYRLDWVYIGLHYSRGLRQVNKPSWPLVLNGWENQAASVQLSVPFKVKVRKAKRSPRAQRYKIQGTLIN